MKVLLIYIILIITLSLIINSLYYFDLINTNYIKYFKMASLLIIYFISGLLMGYNSPLKGYFYGIRLALLIILINIISSLIFNNFSFFLIIYYFIIIFIVTLSSIIGINKK